MLSRSGGNNDAYSSSLERDQMLTSVSRSGGDGSQQEEGELKKNLYESMKNSGVLNSLKSQLRSKLYDQLRLKNERVDVNLKETQNRLGFKIAVSLIADLMKKSDMPYALSVFLPESGITQEILAKSEMVDVMGLQTDDYISSLGDSTPLLLDIVERIKTQKSLTPNQASAYCQTEEAGSESLSLDQKLKRVDYNYLEKVDMERAAPFKSLEERMLKYKHECEARYKNDLQSEVRRLKEFEVSRIRIEEAARYRDKMEAFRTEMENLHLEKVKELKMREESAMDRIKGKERELEKTAYSHRQKVLSSEELMRLRENDVKKTVEMELVLVKSEKDRMAQTILEYERKLSEMECFKLRLEKQHIEDVERFKSEYQRKFKDEDFEIHRRRLAVDEDEHKVQLDKERLLRIETRCQTAEKELEELKKDHKTVNKDHLKLTRDHQDSKEQLKVLNENLKRQTELSQSRERESRSLIDENKTLRVMLEDLKRDGNTLKENQNSLIGNLRMQLDETREMIEKVKDTKEREFRKLREKCDEEIRRETDKYQFEYDKLREEINMFQRRLGQEESLNKQLAVQNTKLGNNLSDLRGQVMAERSEEDADLFRAGFGPGAFHPPQRAEGGLGPEGDEILERKKAWAELEREQAEVKRNIKSLMRLEPGTLAIDDPSLADRVSNVRMQPQTYDTAEDRATEKRMQQQIQNGKAASPAGGMPSHKQTKEKRETPDKSSQKAQPSSGGGHRDSQKRQWLAPSSSAEDFSEKKNTQPKPSEQMFGRGVDSFTSKQQPSNFAAEPKKEEEPTPQIKKKESGGKSLFKASTNPFAKRTPSQEKTASAATGMGAGMSNNNNKSGGMIFPSQQPAPIQNTFSLPADDKPSYLNKKSGRKSSSNIEEDYEDDDFEDFEDSHRQQKSSQPFTSSAAKHDPAKKQTTPEDDIEDFSMGSGFEEKEIEDEYF